MLALGSTGVLSVAGCSIAPAEGEILILDRASLSLDENTAPQDVTLPHHFSIDDRAVNHHGTYRLRFSVDHLSKEVWAVYLAEHRMNAVVHLNGTHIGSGGSIEEPVSRNWNRPMLFTIPRNTLRVGENQLEIALYASPTSTPRLAPVRVGAERDIAPIYARAMFRHIRVRQISVAFLWLIALASTVLAARGAAPRSSLWLAATAWLIGFGQLDGFVRNIPVSTLAWQVANTTAYLAGMVCFVVSVHRLVGIRALRLEVVLGVFAAGIAIASAGIASEYFARATTGILSSSAAVLAYVLWRAYRAGGGSTRRGILALTLALLALGGIDAAHALLGIGTEAPRATGMVPVVVTAFMGWMLLESLRQILDRNDRLNAELDLRIADREHELARSHERLRTMERSATLATERGRLVREMHDGLGNLLVSTLALVEGGERRGPMIADALREVLDEMRLMLDSLEPNEDDLASLLGRVRARLSPRLIRAGLRVDWRIPVDDRLPALEPTTLHHVMRIVQEAIGNVIRHANATTLSIRTRPETIGGVLGIAVEITDDGGGMPKSAQASHRGLAHMYKRADEIGGKLDVDSSSSGTTIRIWFPVPEASNPEPPRSA
jgi:hypothetical protein